MSLDSIYSALARPVRAVFNSRRTVKKTTAVEANAPDSHEAPQSQLPPNVQKKADQQAEQVTKAAKEHRQSHTYPLNQDPDYVEPDEFVTVYPQELDQGAIVEVTDDTAPVPNENKSTKHQIDVKV